MGVGRSRKVSGTPYPYPRGLQLRRSVWSVVEHHSDATGPNERAVIQLARLSGFSTIVTTASPRNAEWLRQLGATHVLDRNLSEATLQAEVKKAVPEPFEIIYDAIGVPETQNFTVDLLAPGGTLALVLEPAIKAERLISGEQVFQVHGNLNVPANRALGTSLFSRLPDLLRDGAIKVSLSATDAR